MHENKSLDCVQTNKKKSVYEILVYYTTDTMSDVHIKFAYR